MDQIGANLERVRERIARAAERSGRRASDVLLIAVAKTFAADRLAAAIAAGVSALGENRVQEARDKIAVLGRRSVQWHLVGHLQTNKVKDALTLFDVIHSVDRLELAREIERRAAEPASVLLQVNLGAEPSKSGFARADVKRALDEMAGLSHVRVRGLMAIPPVEATPAASRAWFRALRELRDETELPELSMGMSADFEVAIEEGATMVRVGTAIFGERARRA